MFDDILASDPLFAPEESARPESWQKTVFFAVPQGAVPERVRIGWEKPFYLDLELPEPTTDMIKKQG